MKPPKFSPHIRRRRPESNDAPGDAPSQGLTRTTPIEAGGKPHELSGDKTVRFAAGDVVAERYRVIRFIAQGGMGEVYEVEDLALGASVALKTIRPEIAANDTMVARFKREINLARQVTHRNVSRIFDLGSHGGASPDDPRVLFLTMELLSGQNLREYIKARRRIPPAEALEITVQMVKGLAAAHRVGIIHRDFKSANVMLIPARPGEHSGRVVVTDFGLARGQISGGELASISESGLVVGTPAYMAPEQVQGLELTQAADIYALGVVLYEMVTGTRPFEGGSALSVAVRRLTQEPRSPRALCLELDPRWEATILRCLERDPERRFAAVTDIAEALGGAPSTARSRSSRAVGAMDEETASSRQAQPISVRPRLTRRLMISIVLLVALTAGGYGLYRLRTPAATGAPASATVAARKSVAVLGLTNISGREDAAWLATAIAEMLSTELMSTGAVRRVTADSVAQASRALSLKTPMDLDPPNLKRLRELLEADFVVHGSYTLLGENDPMLRVELRLVDTVTGEVISGGATGSERQMFDLVDRASRSLRIHLGIGDLPPAQILEVEASLPKNPEAARLYAEGLDHLRRSEFTEARAALQTAVKAAPEHPMPHIQLATVLSALGYGTAAAQSAARAVQLSGALPPAEKLYIEARSYELAQDPARAAEVYRQLVDSFPDDVDSGVRLAANLSAAGRAREALVVVEELRRLPKPLNDDPRIDLTAAWAHFDLGDYEQSEILANAVVAKVGQEGSTLLAARAKLLQANALQIQGKLDESMVLLRDTKELFEAGGDQRGAATCLESMAITLWQQGDLAGAQPLFERALEISREVGVVSEVAVIQGNLGAMAVDQGQMDVAEQRLAEALASFAELGEQGRVAEAQLNMGTLYLGVGELDLANKKYQGAMELYSRLGDRRGIAICLTNIAGVLYLRGQLDQAWDMHQESVAINRQLGDESGEAYDTYRLALVAAERGDDFVAHDLFTKSLEAQERMGERMAAAETRIGLARLELSQGAADSAVKLAQQAEQILRTEGVSELEAIAQAVLGESLMALERRQEAQVAATRASTLAANSADPRVKLHAAMLAARVADAATATTDRTAALTKLDAAIFAAESHGYLLDAMDGRLTRLELELSGGFILEHRRRLETLADEAAAMGLLRIARKARELSSHPTQ